MDSSNERKPTENAIVSPESIAALESLEEIVKQQEKDLTKKNRDQAELASKQEDEKSLLTLEAKLKET